jgi:AraC-like DNA-binding protein
MRMITTSRAPRIDGPRDSEPDPGSSFGSSTSRALPVLRIAKLSPLRGKPASRVIATAAGFAPDLAQLACLSPSQFSRRFRATYGTSPGAYRQALRMNAAKTLLRGRTASLSEIADRLGYRDIFAFSRMFKRHVGLSPRAYRQADGAR